MMAIRSFGPVPLLLSMTMDIPKLNITHPANITRIRIHIGDPEDILSPIIHRNRSMIHPPQNAQTTVPGLTYPFVVKTITIISKINAIT